MSGTKALKAQGAYSRPEGPTNFIIFVLAAGLSFVGLVFLLIKASGHGAAAVVAASVCGGGAVTVFVLGALANIIPQANARRVLYNISRCAVGNLVAAAFAPVLICGLGGAWGYTLFGVSVACAVAACAVSGVGAKHYKLVCLALYVVMGLCCALRLMRIVELIGMDFYWWLLGGGAAYLIGVVLAEYGKIPLNRTFSRLLVVAGAALHFVCVYVYLV